MMQSQILLCYSDFSIMHTFVCYGLVKKCCGHFKNDGYVSEMNYLDRYAELVSKI